MVYHTYKQTHTQTYTRSTSFSPNRQGYFFKPSSHTFSLLIFTRRYITNTWHNINRGIQSRHCVDALRTLVQVTRRRPGVLDCVFHGVEPWYELRTIRRTVVPPAQIQQYSRGSQWEVMAGWYYGTQCVCNLEKRERWIVRQMPRKE